MQKYFSFYFVFAENSYTFVSEEQTSNKNRKYGN